MPGVKGKDCFVESQVLPLDETFRDLLSVDVVGVVGELVSIQRAVVEPYYEYRPLTLSASCKVQLQTWCVGGDVG